MAKSRKSPATIYATVEPDHTIKVPADLPVGARVMVVSVPSLVDMKDDVARRERFAATRAAIARAMVEGFPKTIPTNEEIETLVKSARRSSPNP